MNTSMANIHVSRKKGIAWSGILRMLAPGLFVILWSTGFIVAKFGLPYAPPLTFLLLRFAGVLLILVPCAIVMKFPWPIGQIRHIAFSGLLMQAGYLGGVWCAIKLGMPAGLSALIVGMQPILTAIAAPLIGESVRPRQWLGLLLGIAGVALVVMTKIHLAGLSTRSILLCVMSLVSITAGTLYQKRYCSQFDLRTGMMIQSGASAVVMLPLAIWLEGLRFDFATVSWTAHLVFSLMWAVLALSIAATFLLLALIRRSGATQVSSLMYLTPPTTALMAWGLFGENFHYLGLTGMAVGVIGVGLVVRK